MSPFRQPTRRQFLALAGATTVLSRSAEEGVRAGADEAHLAQRPHPVALLGAGGMGQGDTETALKVPGSSSSPRPTSTTGAEECRKKFGKDLRRRGTTARSSPGRTWTR